MDSEANGKGEERLSVPEAAQPDVPVRSAYKGVESKRVQSQTEGGVVQVEADDLAR
jgi:hypothetical protein